MKLEIRKIVSCIMVTVFALLMAGFSGNTVGTDSQAVPAADMEQGVMTDSFEEAWESLHKAADVEGLKKTFNEASRKRAEEERKEAERIAALEQNLELLSALIFCEAGGEPYEGQVAVGAVIMNRISSGKFPNSLREVIYQSGQFGPAITGKLGRVLASGRTTESCEKAASDAIRGVNPIGDALYFGCGNYGKKIGGHWFH